MDEMQRFLRTIAENPDDDTPRLVFADWLDEHEQPDRARFIRLQIELSHMDPSDDGYAEKTAMMRRCGMFTEEGKQPFFDHLPTEEVKIGFERGFIASLDTSRAEQIDASGFDLVPLQALRTGNKLIDKFKVCKSLRWFEYFNGYGRNSAPDSAKLLRLFGPRGWFRHLEELSLQSVDSACLEAGVIPKFDLPKLRNFYLSTDSVYNLGVFTEGDSDQEDDYGSSRTWNGLPDYLPKNAIPNKNSPLERFIWHCDDDSDYYRDGDYFWAGPTMESLLTHLKPHKLKQVEVAVDWDDHENGSEGPRAASYQQNPLKLCPTLERVTLSGGNLGLLKGSANKLKGLRVYGDPYDGVGEDFFTLLKSPICSGLESLHLEGVYWGRDPGAGPAIQLPKLKSLVGLPLDHFSKFEVPNLISLLDTWQVKTLLERKWPKLQCASVGIQNTSELRAFAKSSCCPNLTTLRISTGYYSQKTKLDLSCLAKCPHMPFLSLIQIPHYSNPQRWIVGDGKLTPVREDVMLEPLTPTTPYRLSSAFESKVNNH